MSEIWNAVSPYLQSNMYMYIEGKRAFIVDPFPSQEALICLRESGVRPEYIFLTHEHYDHISGVTYIKAQYPASKVFCTETCAVRIKDPRLNMSAYAEVMAGISEFNDILTDSDSIQPFSCQADETFYADIIMDWHGHRLSLLVTPGHTIAGASYIVDEKIIFTGDSLMDEVNLRYPTGSEKQYRDITIPKYMRFPDDTMVYPGHGVEFRLGGKLGKWKKKT